MNNFEKLSPLAKQGDALAAYYLGRYYYDECNDIHNAIYWLLFSFNKSCNSAAVFLNKLRMKYPNEVLKAEKAYNKNSIK